jgi:hypothetical protein
MIRSIGIALALAAGTATAGELTDCFNDETDPDTRYTSTVPGVLHISDADIAKMLERIRAHEQRLIAHTERDRPLVASLDTEPAAASD